jgi:hypothetical protein
MIFYVVFIVAIMAIFCHRFYKAASRMKESDQRLNESMRKALLDVQKKMKEKEQQEKQEKNEQPSNKA